MDELPPSADRVHFGVFEVDLASGELRKAGARILLQEQPFRILAKLLEDPGRIVTREELRQQLWPADTFVDFEHGLNAAVKRLRDALGDSADSPRFVETLPRRGYRFIAPVTCGATALASHGASALQPRRSRLGMWLVAAFTVAVITIAAPAWRSLRQPLLTPADVILLADIENRTADPVLTAAIRQELAVRLSESHFIHLLSEERARETLRMMRQAPDQPLTAALARDVCLRAGGKATLSGTIASVGSSFVISLTAASCSTGETLARDQAQASREEQILAATGGLAVRMRRRLGESLPAIDTAPAALARATTTSLEAAKAFTEGETRFINGSQLEAVPFYKRAIELDPEFAMAHAKLGVIYGNASLPGAGPELTRAFELRDHLTEREQLYVTAHYHRLARGDLEASRPIYEVWKASYPRDPVPYTSLGMIYVRRGQYDRAIREFEGAARVAPEAIHYWNLFSMYLQMNRPADAQRLLDVWKRPPGESHDHALFLLAFQRRDLAALEHYAAALRDGQPDDYIANVERARAAMFFGRMARGRQLFAAVTSRRGADFALPSALLILEQAIWEAETGTCPLARSRIVEARDRYQDRLVSAMSALALAACGDVSRSATLLGELNLPEFLGAIIQARIEFERKEFSRALEGLTPFQNADLNGPPGYVAAGQTSGLAAVYLRGRAYLALGRGREAVTEFQKILDYPGVAAFAPYHALAPLYLGRALAMAGDAQGSRVAYERFLRLWQDADDDVPVLRAAREEYRKLS